MLLTDRAKARRRQIAPLLGEGEQAVAFIYVRLARGQAHGSDWLEGAPAPKLKPPPTRTEKVLHVADVVTSVILNAGWTSLQHGRTLPAVNGPFDVTAAGQRGSCAYRLVHATDMLPRPGALYCLVTDRRLVFTRWSGLTDPIEALFEVPLQAVAAVGRRSDCLVVEFTDTSLVKFYASEGLAFTSEAKRLAALLAPVTGREPRLGGYVPPWAAGQWDPAGSPARHTGP